MVNLEPNKQLSIVIPTYNRADFLDYSLEVHIPLLEKHNIQIFVSDNASTDATADVMVKWMEKYPLLHYSRNETNVGPDANFEKALKLPDTDYVWLLGDTTNFDTYSLEKILDAISNKISFDMIVINDSSRVRDTENQVFTEHNKLLTSLGWHMTQMSGLIFSKNILSKANFSRYYNTNFIQTGIIFETLSQKSMFNVCWINDALIKAIILEGIQKKSWESQTFKIWVENWSNFVLSLPCIYTIESKLQTIKKHNDKTKLFTLKSLLVLRSKGYYNYSIYAQYKELFNISFTHKSKIKFIFPLLFPSSILLYIKKFFYAS